MWYNSNIKGVGMLWKFTKGPDIGLTALAVDSENLKDGIPSSEPQEFITLYVRGKTVSFTKEALEQIAVIVPETDTT
jgi:hypothetical protein|tara:strand:+ start:1957 stop:2187 length:231 start_codon:yes stop_codon:yes gene_type:complete